MCQMIQEQTLLVVDDDPANLKAMVGHLEQHGLRVTVARDGQEAIERAQRIRPDLILLDVLMRGMDGYETCRRLKDNQSTRDIPVIFMTVLSDTDHRLAGFDAGGADYVAKPFQITEVMARIRTHLELHSLRRQLEIQNEELRRSCDDLEERVSARTCELTKSRQQVRELSSFLQNIREEENSRIAHELHDEIGSYLTAVKIDVDWLRVRLGEKNQHLAEKTQSMSALVDEAIGAVRRIASNLRPPMLDDLGLPAAVEWMVDEFGRRTDIQCSLDVFDDEIVIPPAYTTAAFRIIQEALTNVVRHARATRVSVRLHRQEGDGILIEVADNGRGIDRDRIESHGSFGLLGMRERARNLGGRFEIRAHDGGGTTVEAFIPMDSITRRSERA